MIKYLEFKIVIAYSIREKNLNLYFFITTILVLCLNIFNYILILIIVNCRVKLE